MNPGAAQGVNWAWVAIAALWLAVAIMLAKRHERRPLAVIVAVLLVLITGERPRRQATHERTHHGHER